MQETLILVHLSSIANYLDFYGREPAIAFTTDMAVAVLTHVGPVILLDQGWSEISEDAKGLRASVLQLQAFRPLVVFHHDELMDISPWQEGMKPLAKLVRSLRTSRVRLGGLWASESGTTGCVHEVQRHLRARNIPSFLDRSICALEEHDTRVK